MGTTVNEFGQIVDDGAYAGSFDDYLSSPTTNTVSGTSFDNYLSSPTNPVARAATTESVFDPTYGGQYSSVPMPTNTGGITNYLKSLDLTTAGGLAGAALGATGAFTNKPKKAYEGKIPQLQAVRNMVTAPPSTSTGYRPGQGGVNYNSDVAYVPRGSVPVGVGTDMATQAAAANAARAAAIAKQNAPVTKPNSTLNTLAKVAGTAGIASLLTKVLGDKANLTGLIDKAGNLTTTGLKTVLDKITGGTKTGTGSNVPGAVGAATRGIGGTGGTGGGVSSDQSERDDAAAVDAEVTDEGVPVGGNNESGEEVTDEGLPVTGDNTAETEGVFGVDDLGTSGLTGGTEISFDDYLSGGSDIDTSGLDTLINYDDVMGGTDYSDYLSGYGDFGLNFDDINFDGYTPDFNYEDYSFARGGMAKGRYLQGNTDGMADKIPARIGQKQPAALSHGEFVVPADVVSHLGNGNSDAGAKKLYQMMDKIRVARTGNKQQGKQINPDKFMPGGLANAYAAGGKVKGFAGPDGSAVGATGLGSAVSAGITGTETGPNSWAGDYMSDLLGKTQALTESPYQQYMGPLTAGASTLQNKTFTGLENTTFPGNLGQSFSSQGAYQAPTMGANAYTPGAIGTGAGAGQLGTGGNTPSTPSQPQGIASQYMNPYLQGVLDPQMAELRRQSQLNLQPGLAKLTQAGGYGGGRQAIMESEANRNLLQEQNKTVGQGYANAYDKAMGQFNTEQAQGRSLADLFAQQGNTQRGIEAEGIAADKAQFEAARENPYKMLQFQQSMLQGMPVSATSYNIAQPTTAQEIMAGAAGGAKAVGANSKTVAQLLKDLGL